MSNHFTVNMGELRCSLHYDNLSPAQMKVLGEKLLANASLMEREECSRDIKAVNKVKETLELTDTEVSFQTHVGKGAKRVYIEIERFQEFLEEAEKIPSLALDRVGDLLVNGVYCWRSNVVVYGAGCGSMLRVPQIEWDDFMKLMKVVEGSINE